MLNTLANQDFIPHHGRDLTEEQVVNGLKSSINLAEDFSRSFFKAGLRTNLTPNATTFSLDDLSHHNILEHDASLRYDAASLETSWTSQEKIIRTNIKLLSFFFFFWGQ